MPEKMARSDFEAKCYHAEGGVRDCTASEYFSLAGYPDIDNHPEPERQFVILFRHITAQNNLPKGFDTSVERLFARNCWQLDSADLHAAILTCPRRLGWTVFTFILTFGAAVLLNWHFDPLRVLSDGDIMPRFLTLPALAAFCSFIFLTACATKPEPTTSPTTSAPAIQEPVKPFMAQVVGLQWLNPLQRRDYSTEWQLLWTLGLVKPNLDDDMVRTNPNKYSTLQTVGSIAVGSEGRETFDGYHEKYVHELIRLFRYHYFTSSSYFYNAHSLEDKKTWRELAGIHVEYALPDGKLDPVEAATFTRKNIVDCFEIGNTHFPTTWSRSTPPDVRVTMGGANAGFTSLAAALDYL